MKYTEKMKKYVQEIKNIANIRVMTDIEIIETSLEFEVKRLKGEKIQ